MDLTNIHITIVGLGYVGLPLAVEFGKKYPTIGFDINQKRIEELEGGFDRTRELTKGQLDASENLTFSTSLNPKKDSVSIYIITVPTPIDAFKKPDLTPLITASKRLGKY